MVAFGPAAIHSQQHFRPILGFGSAAAGMDLQKGVIGINLAVQQGFQLAVPGFAAQVFQMPFQIGKRCFIAFSFRQLGQFRIVLQILLHILIAGQRFFQSRFFAHQPAGFFGIVPQPGVRTQGIQFA